MKLFFINIGLRLRRDPSPWPRRVKPIYHRLSHAHNIPRLGLKHPFFLRLCYHYPIYEPLGTIYLSTIVRWKRTLHNKFCDPYFILLYIELWQTYMVFCTYSTSHSRILNSEAFKCRPCCVLGPKNCPRDVSLVYNHRLHVESMPL